MYGIIKEIVKARLSAVTNIQIKMFDDHLTVESPGMLPGIVRLNNMREIHFSRSLKIAGLLHEYEYAHEFGEGVDCMYYEIERAGLPDPEYLIEAFMVYATIRNKKFLEQQISSTPKIKYGCIVRNLGAGMKLRSFLDIKIRRISLKII